MKVPLSIGYHDTVPFAVHFNRPGSIKSLLSELFLLELPQEEDWYEL